MEKIIGIYHGKCADGATAAAVLLSEYPEIDLHPILHGYKKSNLEEIQQNIDKNTIVYIVDFALREGHTEKIISKARKVINIDHHIGEQEQLETLKNTHDNFDYVFDNNRSGASLTWIYFNGDKNIPEIIKIVEDFDIWKFEFGDRTKYIASYFYTMQDPKVIKSYFINGIEELIEKGKITNHYSEALQKSFLEKIEPVYLKINTDIVPAFNVSFFKSEIGDKLSIKMDCAVILFSITGSDVTCSIRSKDHQSPSALDIAKSLGASGQKNAAGARFTFEKFVELIQK